MNARASLTRALFSACAGLAFGAAACGDPLKSVSLIEETRVLGARVEVDSDPTRSSPNPGESARLRLFLAAPAGEPNVAFGLSVCAVSLTNSGFPRCSGAPFASRVESEATATVPELEFQVPSSLDLASTPHAFASALLCPESSLSTDANGVAICSDGPGRQVAFEFELGGEGRSNLNPAFGPDALTLDGAPWLEPDATQIACPGDLPKVTAKTTHEIGLSLSDSDFEALLQRNEVEPAREAVLVSEFVTRGKLKHAFLSLRADSAPESGRQSWNAPPLLDEAPVLARFYFVVRDGRGGEDFTTRALCVVP